MGLLYLLDFRDSNSFSYARIKIQEGCRRPSFLYFNPLSGFDLYPIKGSDKAEKVNEIDCKDKGKQSWIIEQKIIFEFFAKKNP